MRYTITRCPNTAAAADACARLKPAGYRHRRRGRGPRKRSEHHSIPLTENGRAYAPYFTLYGYAPEIREYRYCCCPDCGNSAEHADAGTVCTDCGRGIVESKTERAEYMTQYRHDVRAQFVAIEPDGRLRVRILPGGGS